MTLAERTGLTQRRWYTPALLTILSFAAGIQVALAFQSLGPETYPPAGKEALAWTSWFLLAAAAVLHAPLTSEPYQRLTAPLFNLAKRIQRATAPEPIPETPAPVETAGPQPAAEPAPTQRLKVRVHTPLMIAPVVAPGEAIPVTVTAEPEELAKELEITFAVEESKDARETTMAMRGTDLVHSETFQAPGPYTLEVRVHHPQAEADRPSDGARQRDMAGVDLGGRRILQPGGGG
ncbi:MAG: hypothetical protein R3185_00645, partial [Candidatus Thermoplasmatota archaeon]|nr:hypothetical protein [Candidatus Thermoplasmatota archaeon]